MYFIRISSAFINQQIYRHYFSIVIIVTKKKKKKEKRKKKKKRKKNVSKDVPIDVGNRLYRVIVLFVEYFV